MKKNICLALIMAMFFAAGAVRAEGVYVLPGGVGTRITSLPYTISTPGYYYFGGNLSGNLASGNAITINADNVTLDLMGFSLTNTHAGAAAIGISMSGRNNVAIRNGSIINFEEGVIDGSSDAANHRLSNLRFNNNGRGVMLRGYGHLVQNCTASNNSYGFYLDGGTISNCVACDNTTTGIILTGAGSVLGNIANNNTTRNFSLGFTGLATNITVNRNSASGLATNYYTPPGSGGVVISALNAGQP